MSDEIILGTVDARRKGRDQRPCTLQVGYMDDGSGDVVLRTTDIGGVPPLVALLSVEAARQLGEAFIAAADTAE